MQRTEKTTIASKKFRDYIDEVVKFEHFQGAEW